MTRKTGYKATRKTIAEKRLEHRMKIWRESDPPYYWGRGQLCDPADLRELLNRDTGPVDPLDRGEAKVHQAVDQHVVDEAPGSAFDIEGSEPIT
jgi:hypothetical protein